MSEVLVDPFNWERDYGPLYRACPSAFWLAPEPGDRKPDVIDVRPKRHPLLNTTPEEWMQHMSQLQYAQMYQSAWSQNYRGSPGASLLGNLLGF